MPWDESVWNAPLLDGIRRLSTSRAETPALRRGTQDVVALDRDTVLILRRSDEHSAAVLGHRGAGADFDVTTHGRLVGLAEGTVCVPARSTTILGTTT